MARFENGALVDWTLDRGVHHQGLQNRTPHEAFLAWEAIRFSEVPIFSF
jgi:hypothetical protein